MYQLFIANKNYSSWSLRPWLLLRQLEIPFGEELVTFEEGGSWDKFRRFAPNGLVPCLVDGEATVWDSLAIAEYLAEEHPGIWPVEKGSRAWARCAAAEMHSGFFALRDICSMNCGVRVQLAEIPAKLQKDIDRIDELWCEGLRRFGGPYLAGEEFTAVDAFFAPVAIRAKSYSLPLSDTAAAYAERLLQLPAMQAWIAEALQEPWREVGHEEELLRAGAILEDLRQ
ncbi:MULTISPECIES: glutathione S-transferase family protein [unclassified Microbulbifer]|uniref:glutathione S-transferase family protein n=1 Tax=unclassified Microbulbifer TaxID=2619833 RepID=UPI0027E468EF|nr:MULTISPECIES: glutathione S-transferase family protein [unclassified Microbulbifer]